MLLAWISCSEKPRSVSSNAFWIGSLWYGCFKQCFVNQQSICLKQGQYILWEDSWISGRGSSVYPCTSPRLGFLNFPKTVETLPPMWHSQHGLGTCQHSHHNLFHLVISYSWCKQGIGWHAWLSRRQQVRGKTFHLLAITGDFTWGKCSGPSHQCYKAKVVHWCGATFVWHLSTPMMRLLSSLEFSKPSRNAHS